MAFYACSSCSRYVKEHENACPFCGAARGGSEHTVRSFSIRGISRGQWLTAGAAALALVSCDAPNGDAFFECSVTVPTDGGAISATYCEKRMQYCSAQGTCVTIADSGPCAVVSPGNVCLCDEDAGVAVQRCSTKGFFDCSAGGSPVSYCEKWTQYCSTQGTCVTIADAGSCAVASSGTYQCTCTEDAGATFQTCTSHSGCYGAPPARLERLAATSNTA